MKQGTLCIPPSAAMGNQMTSSDQQAIKSVK